MKYDIVGIDSPCMDMVVNLNSFPEPNNGGQIQNLSWQGGGKVATGMVAAARLGAKGAILGAVGDDVYGRFCDRDFLRHGIDTAHLQKRKGQTTGFSIVLSNRETMGRSIIYMTGTAEPLCHEEIPAEYLTNTKYFFVAMLNEVVNRAIDTAKTAGAKICIDADFYTEDLRDIIPKVDVFIASEFVYEALFHDDDYEANCRKIMDRGPEIVVFTFGEKGCVGLSGEGYFEIPAFQVDAVDTVGAGDVYHGAFLAGLLKGLPVVEVARMASAVSAIKCTRIGGRAGIPDMDTVQHFMRTGEIDYTEIDARVEFYKRGIEHI